MEQGTKKNVLLQFLQDIFAVTVETLIVLLVIKIAEVVIGVLVEAAMKIPAP